MIYVHNNFEKTAKSFKILFLSYTVKQKVQVKSSQKQKLIM